MPETTDKILIEVANQGHGAAAYPYGEVSEYILLWLEYQVLDNNSVCESLLESPSIASLYLTNIDCNTIIDGDEKFIVDSTKKTNPNFLVNNDTNIKNENDIFSAFKIVGEFLDKSILKPNNISFPSSRIEFGKLIKQI